VAHYSAAGMGRPSSDVVVDPPANREDATGSTSDRPHFPCLEGLRAIAALLVVLTHAGSLTGDARAGWLARPAKMGDIGVAVFFVLSGFLIYRPFARAHFAGERPIEARAFWWRRLLRIVPAYWLALAVLWGLWRFHPGGFRMGFDLGHDWWRYFALLQIYRAQNALGGIVQAWSIATEITFYLAIPFWSGLVRRLAPKGRSALTVELGGVAALFSAGYLSRWAFSHTSHLFIQPNPLQPAGVKMRDVAFSWLPNQIDLFALGMAIAVLHVWASRTGRLERLGRVLGRAAGLWWAAALGLFAVIVYVLGPPTLSTGYKSAYWQARQALYGGVAVLLLVPLVFGDQARGGVRRALRWRPVWWVGVVSYGFYLWHLDWMNRAVTPGVPAGFPVGWTGWTGAGAGHANLLAVAAIGLAGGLACAALSYYLFERPLLRFKGLVGTASDRTGADRPDAVV
jgi:peptidoglycan/LPS O-acetylase OafA/YrhL